MGQRDKNLISPDDVLVRVEETPNPYALKFVTNHAFKREGKASFKSREESASLPLVFSLFDLPGVIQVYLYQNTLTLTHQGQMEEGELVQQVVSVIQTRMSVHNPDFVQEESLMGGYSEKEGKFIQRKKLKDYGDSESLEEIQKIEAILDRTVRPGLQSDGGDIEVIEFKNNQLKVLYQGACGGCPSAMMGTLDAIQNILQYETKNENLLVIPI